MKLPLPQETSEGQASRVKPVKRHIPQSRTVNTLTVDGLNSAPMRDIPASHGCMESNSRGPEHHVDVASECGSAAAVVKSCQAVEPW